MASGIEERLREKLREIAREAIRRTKPFVPSETIKNSLQFRTVKTPEGFEVVIFSPYYWAGILHQGHGPIYSDIGKKLVYFRDPSNDPRMQPWKNYPKKIGDIKHLTEDQFYEGMARNYAMFKANPSGGFFQYMVVVISIEGRPGTPFFALGLDGFGEYLDKTLKPIVRDTVIGSIKAAFPPGRFKFSIKI